MAWEKQSKFGYKYDVLIQGEEADCGPCCCAMIVNLLGQGKPPSSTIQKNLPKGAYTKSTKDRSGMVATPLVGLEPSFHSDGTYINALSKALAMYHISNTPHAGQDVTAALGAADHKHPLIVLVSWNGGGGHWVVIAKSSGSAQFVLDPYYGFGINNSTATYSGTKKGADGRIDNVLGNWEPYWLRVD